MVFSLAEVFLLERKPVESLGFTHRAGLHQLHTLHGAVGFVPGVLAEISEDLSRLLDALKIPDRYNSPGIVGADAERHGVTFQEGKAAWALGPFGDSHHCGAPPDIRHSGPAPLRWRMFRSLQRGLRGGRAHRAGWVPRHSI